MDWVGNTFTLAGGAGFLFGLVFLVIQISRAGDASLNPQDVINNYRFLEPIFISASAIFGIGLSVKFWGETAYIAIGTILGALAAFAPSYLPLILGNSNVNETMQQGYNILTAGGILLAGITLISLVINIAQDMSIRFKQGAKQELKLGKDVKQEEVKNVFLGKCWQLPFCRKFIREKCPIYHSRRTCWRERVGCMCEETVIRNAMDNRAIPKDQLLAAKMIPYNRTLPMAAKIERCRNCVIYNEHQKQKYKLVLPIVLLMIVGSYILFRQPLLEGIDNLVVATGARMEALTGGGPSGPTGVIPPAPHSELANQGTTATTQAAQQEGPRIPALFKELGLVAFFLILLAYAVRVVEYFIFVKKI